jgi:glycosyltransferase involved in cell wall biosynthesis
MIIGIDASHTVVGGAISHLKNLLTNIDFNKYCIKYIYVWAPKETLSLLPRNKFIIYKSHFLFKYNFIFKIFWQIFFFSRALKKNNCNIAFITASYFFIDFKPIVTLSQNVLPFYPEQVRKYFPSFFYIKLVILKLFLIRSFNKTHKVIFLSKYVKNLTVKFLRKNLSTDEISHCINHDTINFFRKNVSKIDKKNIKVIFISDITFYKNHHNILLAISSLRKNYNIELILIGGYELRCFNNFIKLKKQLDHENKFILYKGILPHKETMQILKDSDIFFYSSYCESFSVSILEGMASGKPMLVSNIPVFREILGSNAIYFNIDSLEDLKSKLIKTINLSLNKKKLHYKKNYKLLLTKYSQKLVREKTFLSLKKTFDGYYS